MRSCLFLYCLSVSPIVALLLFVVLGGNVFVVFCRLNVRFDVLSVTRVVLCSYRFVWMHSGPELVRSDVSSVAWSVMCA